MGTGLRTPTGVMLAVQLAFLGAAIQTSTAHAQLVPSVGAASAPAVDPMERAQRQADNVMRWIKVHADKPRAAPAAPAKPSEPPAAVAAKPAPAPVPKVAATVSTTPPVAESPKPVVVATPEPVAPVPAVTPPPVVAPAPIAPPAAAPAVAVKAPPPPPSEDDDDDTPLKPIAQDYPVMPRNVLAALTSTGKVMVQFKVETNGSVSNVQVLSSSRAQLNKPTMAAVANWRFEPVKTPRVAQIEFAFTP